MKYLILDVDTGVDDALAILYALGLEREGALKLAGVTCTFGNVTVKTAVRNSRAILDFLGRSDIPVYGGHNRLFGSGEEFAPRPICKIVHGENGIGNVDIPMPEEKNGGKGGGRSMEREAAAGREAWSTKGDKNGGGGENGKGSREKTKAGREAGSAEEDRNGAAVKTGKGDRTENTLENRAGSVTGWEKDSPAVRFLTEMAARYGRDLAVIGTASMANLAEWVRDHREEAGKTGTVAIMGGALTVPGNVNPFAEANILADPGAAKFLFESGIPFTMTGLDVTLKTNRRADQMAEKTGCWEQEGGERGRTFARMLYYYCTNEAPANGNKEGAIHDPLAVAAVFRPELVKTLDINLTVETEGPSAGRTIGDLRKLTKRKKTARVCVDVDEEAFLDDFARTCLGAF